ncbi:MAG: fatty acid desaturase [Bdellovibrionales bacterium]|nr:fatty acid desaturase [Bdellovibrionales bacterium]
MNNDFIRVNYPEPHRDRAKRIIQAHPEVRELFGNTPSTFLWVLAVVAIQTAMAWFLRDASWGWVLLAAFTIGATCNHAVFVLIHECAHNLIFKGSDANRMASIAVNLPAIFPAAIGFRNFHLLHHFKQGEHEYDADLAGPVEAKLMGRSPFTKVIWLLGFIVVEGFIRPMRVRKVDLLDRWTLLNIVAQAIYFSILLVFMGWISIGYLVLSSVFAIGLHPFGARWIQEHYVVHGSQETYSYYGPLNWLMFNVGYHNEHHDLMMVPWSRLKKLKAMAPEFYENLYSHHSYVRLLFQFIFDSKLNLHSRVVRAGRKE